MHIDMDRDKTSMENVGYRDVALFMLTKKKMRSNTTIIKCISRWDQHESFIH